MKSVQDTFALRNGVNIPCVGFGVLEMPDGDATVSAVKEALAAGYRHIDTAAAYGNEESVGRAVRESGVARGDVFVTSKLHNDMHGYDNTMRAFDDTMEKLGFDVLDLYLIHWPNPIKYRDQWQEANAGTWRAFEELYAAKRVRAIGVSNFRSHHFRELEKTLTVMPMVNQVRLCPGETQPDASSYCIPNNILLEAYSPLGRGQIFNVKEMQQLAAKYGKSIAQLCIRWNLQRGCLPLPKSVTPSRIRENMQVFDFTLSDEDIDLISSLTECCGPTRDPDTTQF